MDLEFNLPKEQSSIIKVIGVGGGGGNAVNYMFENGIKGVNFVVTNTDAQALETSPIPNKIQLGPEITQGLGAGSRPEVGMQATIESEQEIIDLLRNNTKMVFITAGMGGGTGTGGAPEIARIAKEMGILTVGIVTTPFSFEGRRKLLQAEEGIQKLRKNVDSILVISNDKIREVYGNLSKSEAFGQANDILSTAAKSISEIITIPGEINVDFADVQYVMKDSGVAIMGSSTTEGENRAETAILNALNSPLLNDNNITGAQHILINISSGTKQVTIDEITQIHEIAQDAAGNDTDVIFGTCDDESLGEKISVTIIATGFNKKTETQKEEKTEVIQLDETISNENEETTVVLEEEREIEWNTEEEQTKDEKDLLDFKVKDEKNEQNNELSFYTSQKKEDPTPKREETEMDKELRDRKERLRQLNYKWSHKNINELENEPAYKRRNIELENVKHSSENNVSRYTLNDFNVNGESKPEIRKNNSYLNDNVD